MVMNWNVAVLFLAGNFPPAESIHSLATLPRKLPATGIKYNRGGSNPSPFFILYTLLLKGRASVSVYLSRFARLMNTVWHGLRRFDRLGRRFHNWHTIKAQGSKCRILNKSTAPTAMSRIIEQNMIRAINYECDWRKDNTEVVVIHHGIHGTFSYQKEIQVKLHGHTIARIFPGDRMILSSCGWETKTTKSRLNAILHHYNLSGIYQEKFVWYCEQGVFEDNTEFAIRR
jgi:hypothetical protein